MSPTTWPSYVPAIMALLTGLGVVVRYMLKIEGSFAEQRVMNAEHLAAVRELRHEMQANKELNEEQHDRLGDRIDYHSRRLALQDDGR